MVAQSEEACRLYSSPEKRREMARDLETKGTSPPELAETWAEAFRPSLRQEIYAACLKGLTS
jgi:hypothetical protein